ncbi:MAG: hypothetical protein IPJ26_09085 [Bacteroidetes bacterium]|nr:hypothetical protein [Bacteroidota bacterium]
MDRLKTSQRYNYHSVIESRPSTMGCTHRWVYAAPNNPGAQLRGGIAPRPNSIVLSFLRWATPIAAI